MGGLPEKVHHKCKKCKKRNLQFADEVDKPISKEYITEVKADKKPERKAGKIINSLVRNNNMTPAEAKQAVLTTNEPKQKRKTKQELFYFFLIRNNK